MLSLKGVVLYTLILGHYPINCNFIASYNLGEPILIPVRNEALKWACVLIVGWSAR